MLTTVFKHSLNGKQSSLLLCLCEGEGGQFIPCQEGLTRNRSTRCLLPVCHVQVHMLNKCPAAVYWWHRLAMRTFLSGTEYWLDPSRFPTGPPVARAAIHLPASNTSSCDFSADPMWPLPLTHHSTLAIKISLMTQVLPYLDYSHRCVWPIPQTVSILKEEIRYY